MSNDGKSKMYRIFVLISSRRLGCQWDGIRALFLLRLEGDKARLDKNKLKLSYINCCEH